MDEDFDTILERLGVGKWNIMYYVFASYWHIVTPPFTIAGVFMAPPVDHTCRLYSNASLPTIDFPSNFTEAQNATAIKSTFISNGDSCSYVKEDAATGRQEKVLCTQWDFDNSTYINTVTSEFGLVCEYRYLRATFQSLYMFGVFVGAAYNGFLADRYGRLKVVSITSIAYSVIVIGSAWLPTLELVFAFRFLLGTMHCMILTTGFILVMEVTQIKWRSAMGTLINSTMWSIGTMLWGLYAYLERDWRWLQTYVSLPLPFILPLLLFMNESPRWLVVAGRHKEALSVLQRAARMNNTRLPPTDHLLAIMRNVHQQSAAKKTSVSVPRRIFNQITALFSTRKLTTITVVMCFAFFSGGMVFFGLTLSASALNIDNPFVYLSISGSAELPAFLLIFILEKIGRKKTGIMCFGVCAITVVLHPLLPASLEWLSLSLVMGGKLAASSAFNFVLIYSSELYPTEIRSQGLNAGMMASRVGAFIAPFTFSLLENKEWAVPVVFGVVSGVAAVSFAWLWETVDSSLPDTMAQTATHYSTPAEMPLEVCEYDSTVKETPTSASTLCSSTV